MSDSDRIAILIKELEDLRVQESDLIRRIEEENSQRVNGQDDTVSHQVGDRVYVTSRTRRPVFAPVSWTHYSERRATVTKVIGKKIFIKTDNGTETWRADKNLRLLST